MNCHKYTVAERYDTAGRPVYGWKCYCGTTACLQQKAQNYSVVGAADQTGKDCDCVYETTLTEKGLCRKCEDRFYNGANGVLRSKLL